MYFSNQKKFLRHRINSRDKKLNELEKESKKTTNKFNSKIRELENQLKSTNDILNKIKSLKISFDKINTMNLKEEEKMMKIKQINEYINKISLLEKEIFIKGIIEANLKPEKNELDTVPCNIVADKDGVICKINALEGMPLVTSGDVVNSGDILISGIIKKESLPTRLVNSKGEVYIKTWYTHKETAQLERDIISYTGNTENKFGIEIQNYKINFGNTSTKFEKYDTIVAKNKLNLLGIFELPIALEQITYKEIDVETVKYTKNQAINLAVRTIENKMAEKVKGIEIVNKDIKVIEGEKDITVVVTLECIEKVGIKRKLEG